MTRAAKWTLGTVASILCLGVVLQWLGWKKPTRTEKQSIGLANRIPRQVSGWIGRDEALGETELTRRAVENILNFDEAIYRIYRQGSREFGVYVAYWAPGRMPTRLIELHTPDRCWVENGWLCQGSKFAYRLAQEAAFPPAQWRVFTPPGRSEQTYVLFWLLVGDRSYDFGERLNRAPNPFRWWGQFVQEVTAGYRGHLFVRLTSNHPFEELAGDAGWQQVTSALVELGVVDKSASHSARAN